MAEKRYKSKNSYKDVGMREKTISINPMQDDMEKLIGAVGVTAAPSRLFGSTATKSAVKNKVSKLGENIGKSTLKQRVKDFFTSKTNIGATAGAAGYKMGKAEGKRYGGMSKKDSKKSVMKKDIEIYQNDRTVQPDPRMFEQEDQTISYEIPEGRQGGGMSCPYRRKGAKSSIQGVKDIQLKGGKFIGCK